MKLTKSPCKITGIALGEASINLIRAGVPAFAAKFAYVTEDEGLMGYIDLKDGWSDNVTNALMEFVKVVEEDMLWRVFKIKEDEVPKADQPDSNDPPQF